jgi:hypothetical protein
MFIPYPISHGNIAWLETWGSEAMCAFRHRVQCNNVNGKKKSQVSDGRISRTEAVQPSMEMSELGVQGSLLGQGLYGLTSLFMLGVLHALA